MDERAKTLNEVQTLIEDMKTFAVRGRSMGGTPTLPNVDSFIACGQKILSFVDNATYYNPFSPSQLISLKKINLHNKLGNINLEYQGIKRSYSEEYAESLQEHMLYTINDIENALDFE